YTLRRAKGGHGGPCAYRAVGYRRHAGRRCRAFLVDADPARHRLELRVRGRVGPRARMSLPGRKGPRAVAQRLPRVRDDGLWFIPVGRAVDGIWMGYRASAFIRAARAGCRRARWFVGGAQPCYRRVIDASATESRALGSERHTESDLHAAHAHRRLEAFD